MAYKASKDLKEPGEIQTAGRWAAARQSSEAKIRRLGRLAAKPSAAKPAGKSGDAARSRSRADRDPDIDMYVTAIVGREIKPNVNAGKFRSAHPFYSVASVCAFDAPAVKSSISPARSTVAPSDTRKDKEQRLNVLIDTLTSPGPATALNVEGVDAPPQKAAHFRVEAPVDRLKLGSMQSTTR